MGLDHKGSIPWIHPKQHWRSSSESGQGQSVGQSGEGQERAYTETIRSKQIQRKCKASHAPTIRRRWKESENNAVINMTDITFEEAWDLLKAFEGINMAEFFAGLGGSELMQHMGAGGWGGAARERGHNVHGYEIDPSLKQGDPKYHIRDIMDTTAEEVMDDFDWEELDAAVASPPCKAFSTASGNKGWQWDQRWIDQYSDLSGKDWRDDKSTGWHWDKLKPYFNQARGQGDKIGFSGVVPAASPDSYERDEQGAYLDMQGKPMMTRRGGQNVAMGGEQVQSAIDRRNHGLGMMEQSRKLMDDLKALNPNMFQVFENPATGRARYMDALSDLPMKTIDAAAYRDPAHSQLFGLPPNEDLFEMTPGKLPALKPTDLFGHFPSSFKPRPRIPRSYAGQYYEKAPRGTKSGIQGVGDLPANSLFPGSPTIDKFHLRSVIPYWLGHDFINAVEQDKGIRAPSLGTREIDQFNFNAMPNF